MRITHLISNSVSKTDAGKTTLRVPDVEEWKTIGEKCKTYCEFVACFKYETCSG